MGSNSVVTAIHHKSDHYSPTSHVIAREKKNNEPSWKVWLKTINNKSIIRLLILSYLL